MARTVHLVRIMSANQINDPQRGSNCTPPPAASHPELFTDETAAAYIGDITARAVRDWRTKRGLPFIRVTSRVNRIRKADLDDWLARRQVAISRRGL